MAVANGRLPILIVGALACLDIAGLLPLAAILEPLADGTSAAATALLSAIGVEVFRDQGLIYLGGDLAFQIDYRCTGIWPVAILCSLLLAEPLPPPYRPIAMMAGASTLLAVNLLRLLSLFWVGTAYPAWFAVVHDGIWPVATVGVIAGLWYVLRRPGPSWRNAQAIRSSLNFDRFMVLSLQHSGPRNAIPVPSRGVVDPSENVRKLNTIHEVRV